MVFYFLIGWVVGALVGIVALAIASEIQSFRDEAAKAENESREPGKKKDENGQEREKREREEEQDGKDQR